jgi:paraquat-inducible protein A
MCYTSAVLFLVGISAVAMSLVAFKDMPVIGRVVFKFEAKGIADTIVRMFTSGNIFLGGLIFVLSIAFPLAKLGATWYATLASASHHEIAMHFIKALGKWSMADVFVLAVILSCFAIDGDKLTDARIGPGVYFFAAYCILSVWAGICLAHVPFEEVVDSERE